MENQIPENVSKRITSLRFLLAVLVVFIHNNFSIKSIADGVAKGGAEIVFVPNVFTQWLQSFISEGLAVCAVPLFFVFAAYLQARKSDSYALLLKKRAKSLLVPYFAWFVIYLIYYYFGKKFIEIIFPSMIAHHDNVVANWNVKQWFVFVIGYAEHLGLKIGSNNPQFAGQFWFVRDLFILIILSPLIIKLIKKFPAGFLTLVSFLYLANIPLFIVGTNALFFYAIGLFWGLYNLKLLERIDQISWKEILCIFLLLFFIKNLCFQENVLCSGFFTLISCVLFLKFSSLLVESEKIYACLSYLSGFSFFLYAIHMPALLLLVQKVWIHFIPMKNPFLCLFEYYGVTILVIVIGTMIGIILRKIFPWFYTILNGGRR